MVRNYITLHSSLTNFFFLGIMRCDYIAEGVIKATKELGLTIPLIVRLKGTKEAEAKQYVSRIILDGVTVILFLE